MKLLKSLFIAALSLLPSVTAFADIERIEINNRNTLSDSNVDFSYESISGVAYFTLDPNEDLNGIITDIAYAPVNGDGLIEYAADFRLLIPSASVANGGLLYNVNNRGGSSFPPERSLLHPLSGMGFTYLA
ncbi:MAG: hypothetical protein QMC06_05610, partial [Gammaproteobacteria bacterium]